MSRSRGLAPDQNRGDGVIDRIAPEVRRIVVVGAGGFGRGALDVIDEVNAQQRCWDFLGFLDDRPLDGVIGDTASLTTIDVDAYVIAIADPDVRRMLDSSRLEAARLVGPSAVVSHRSKPGPGTVIRSNTSVAADVRIGRHVHLNMNVTIGHDARLADYVTVHPGVNISGHVHVGEAASLGTGAVVLPGIELGVGAIVGAGAVVVDDVPDRTVVVGNPARPLEGARRMQRSAGRERP